MLSVESVLHLASRRDADSRDRSVALAPPHRLRADDARVRPSAAEARRIAACRRDSRSLADGARASVPPNDHRVEGLQDRICDRANRSSQRVGLAGDRRPVPVLHAPAHRGRAQDPTRSIDGDDRARAGPSRLASHTTARWTDAHRARGTLARHSSPRAGGRSSIASAHAKRWPGFSGAASPTGMARRSPRAWIRRSASARSRPMRTARRPMWRHFGRRRLPQSRRREARVRDAAAHNSTIA